MLELGQMPDRGGLAEVELGGWCQTSLRPSGRIAQRSRRAAAFGPSGAEKRGGRAFEGGVIPVETPGGESAGEASRGT